MWRAHFEPEDRLTPELLAPLMAQHGLDVPETYQGTSTSRYLAAVADTSLDALMRIVGQQSATRIDSTPGFEDAEMLIAAVAERASCDSYHEFKSFQRDFIKFGNLLSQEEAQYLIAYYYLNLPSEERIRASNYLPGAAALALKQGRDPLALTQSPDHLLRVLRQMPHIVNAGYERERPIEYWTLMLLFTTLTLDFSEAELSFLLLEEEATSEELGRVALLRSEQEPGDAGVLLNEVRSMPTHWLDSLLA